VKYNKRINETQKIDTKNRENNTTQERKRKRDLYIGQKRPRYRQKETYI